MKKVFAVSILAIFNLLCFIYTGVAVVENLPPVADAGPDQTVEQTMYTGAEVLLDGSYSSDDGLPGPLTYTWTWEGGSATGPSPIVEFPLGITTVTLIVSDGQFNASDLVVVTVVDTTPPTVTIIYPADGAEFWVDEAVNVSVTVSDLCDPSPSIEVTPSLSIPPPLPPGELTITASATDASGNTGSDVITVVVIAPVSVDINPGSWPNPLQLRQKGSLPVALCGTEEFDVTTVDPETIRLALDGVGVAPLRWSYEDAATPYEGEPYSGHDLDDDGYIDLTLKFNAQEVILTLGLDAFSDRDVIILTLTGNLKAEHGGTPIQGQDCVVILQK